MKTTMRSIFLWMRGKVICCLHGSSSFVGMAGNPLPSLFHFEDRLIRKGKRWTLKWKLNPMPTKLTDEMKAILHCNLINFFLKNFLCRQYPLFIEYKQVV